MRQIQVLLFGTCWIKKVSLIHLWLVEFVDAELRIWLANCTCTDFLTCSGNLPAYLRDISHLMLDHYNKANISIKSHRDSLVSKGMLKLCLHYIVAYLCTIALCLTKPCTCLN